MPPLIDSQTDMPLSPLGRAQVRALGERLAATPFAALFVSPMARTAQTVEPPARARGLEPVVVDELRDVFLGEWEAGVFGRRVAAGDPLATELFRRGRWDVLPCGEAPEALAARVRAALDRVVAATGPDATALVVTHGGVIDEACRQVTGSAPFAFIQVENASMTRLVGAADGRWTLVSFNDTAHLTGATGEVSDVREGARPSRAAGRSRRGPS